MLSRSPYFIPWFLVFVGCRVPLPTSIVCPFSPLARDSLSGFWCFDGLESFGDQWPCVLWDLLIVLCHFSPDGFSRGSGGSWRRPRGEASSDRVTASIVHSTMDGALSRERQLPNISAVKCPFTSFPHLTFGKKFSHTWGGVALCLTEGGLLT